MRLILIALCFVSLGTFAAPEKIFLFRHAEKQLGNNPSLTKDGLLRAQWMAKYIIEFKPNQLFSTDYNRTKETLRPLSEKTKVDLVIYDPRKLNVFADKLKTLSGTIVVVGHSNTTPMLAGLIDGKNYKKFDEKHFDAYFEIKHINNQFSAQIKQMGLK